MKTSKTKIVWNKEVDIHPMIVVIAEKARELGFDFNTTDAQEMYHVFKETSVVYLKKFKVCTDCHAIGIHVADCVCVYSRNYPTIELEFEVNAVTDEVDYDFPADTEFNKAQYAKNPMK